MPALARAGSLRFASGNLWRAQAPFLRSNPVQTLALAAYDAGPGRFSRGHGLFRLFVIPVAVAHVKIPVDSLFDSLRTSKRVTEGLISNPVRRSQNEGRWLLQKGQKPSHEFTFFLRPGTCVAK